MKILRLLAKIQGFRFGFPGLGQDVLVKSWEPVTGMQLLVVVIVGDIESLPVFSSFLVPVPIANLQAFVVSPLFLVIAHPCWSANYSF
jgi:hypothetical protein